MASHGAKSNFFDSDNLNEFLYFETDTYIQFDSDSDDYSDSEEETIEDDVVERLQAITTKTADTDSDSDNEVPMDNVHSKSEDLLPVTHTAGTLKETINCKCDASSCVSVLGVDKVVKAKDLAQSVRAMGKTHFDIMILSKLSVCLVNTEQVSADSHRSKERLKSRITYMHEGKSILLFFFVKMTYLFGCFVYNILFVFFDTIGVKICRSAFLFMNNLGNGLLIDLTLHYKKHGLCPREFYYKGRNSKAVTYEQAKHIVDFLNNISNIHALALPGRVPGKFNISRSSYPTC